MDTKTLGRRMATMALAASLSCAASGCYSVRFDLEESPNRSVAFSRTESQGKFLRHFSVEEKAWFLAYGLIKLGAPDLGRVVASEAGPEARVANLRIKSQVSFVDGLIPWVLALVVANASAAAAASSLATGGQTTAAGYTVAAALLGFLIPSARTIQIEGDIFE